MLKVFFRCYTGKQNTRHHYPCCFLSDLTDSAIIPYLLPLFLINDFVELFFVSQSYFARNTSYEGQSSLFLLISISIILKTGRASRSLSIFFVNQSYFARNTSFEGHTSLLFYRCQKTIQVNHLKSWPAMLLRYCVATKHKYDLFYEVLTK